MDGTRLVITVTIIFSEAVQLMSTVGAQFANNVSSVRGWGRNIQKTSTDYGNGRKVLMERWPNKKFNEM